MADTTPIILKVKDLIEIEGLLRFDDSFTIGYNILWSLFLDT